MLYDSSYEILDIIILFLVVSQVSLAQSPARVCVARCPVEGLGTTNALFTEFIVKYWEYVQHAQWIESCYEVQDYKKRKAEWSEDYETQRVEKLKQIKDCFNEFDVKCAKTLDKFEGEEKDIKKDFLKDATSPFSSLYGEAWEPDAEAAEAAQEQVAGASEPGENDEAKWARGSFQWRDLDY